MKLFLYVHNVFKIKSYHNNVINLIKFYKFLRLKIFINYFNSKNLNKQKNIFFNEHKKFQKTLGDIFIPKYTITADGNLDKGYVFLLSHCKGVNCFSLRSKAATSIIAGGLNGTVKLWNRKNNIFRMFCFIKISNKPVCDIIQLPNPGTVLINHYGNNIIILDLRTLKVLKRLRIGKFFTVMKKNTCNTNSILTGCSDGFIYDWNINTGI